MEIISLQFALLGIASIFVFYLINFKYRVVYLTILSCGFILSYSYYLLLYVLAYTVINYYLGIKISLISKNFKKVLFRTGIIINLSQLILLKYSTFLIDPFFHFFNSDVHISKLSQIIIPLGISYFTLQGIGYLINIKMGWEKPENRFVNLFLYFTFFPKYLSGPIERSNHFLPQLRVDRHFDEQQVSEGIRIMLIGFFKKVVIATYLGSFVTHVHSNLNLYSGIDLWIVAFIQPLYLYFDFSGYTDIAIGLAKTYGIELLPNFNRPFLSENMTTFWRRFHISLSSWFNDFVFKQLSFKYRHWGSYASIFAVFVTWTLFGIWHGAGWNFMALGLLQAIAIVYEFYTKAKRIEIGSKLPLNWRKFFSRIITYIFYGFSLIFFFSPNLKSSIQFYYKLINFKSWEIPQSLNNLFLFALGWSIVFILIDYLKEDHEKISSKIEKIYYNNKYLRIALNYFIVMLILIFIGKKLTFVYQVF
jgi:alginate O-acetyltransferase complex protein AlgI